ncbi:hypothetical protein [Methylovulum psychrotolerans]|uniref:Uncharacterized protein n=1 Tax=Methylovulum psychrotolerans TaxID=1704499 RepID=A0A1Z4BYE7_9GAMM|nr:hypothetical protein [Methylovulum psychrotolerans]ASF46279.1 hypothetical protein CEK71_09405 [Methylovulum psychrotolerans]
MQAIEFETHLHNGLIQLPMAYQNWQEGKSVKVIVLVDEATEENARPAALHSINRHAGKLALTQDPLEFQQTIRDEWA